MPQSQKSDPDLPIFSQGSRFPTTIQVCNEKEDDEGSYHEVGEDCVKWITIKKISPEKRERRPKR